MIVIILAVIAVFFYINTNIAENIEQDTKNSERCAEFDINEEEGETIGYGDGIKKLLKGCF